MFLVSGNLEGAVVGAPPIEIFRVNAQAFAGSVTLESSATAEGMVANEMMVEAASPSANRGTALGKSLKLREDPRGVHVWAFS